MDTSLRDQVRSLVETSESLRAAVSERLFWQTQVEVMNEPDLLRLKEVLEYEQKEAARIKSDHEARLLEIDKEHLQSLQDFKRVDIPRFLKQWEQISAAKEAPEDILKQITDA